MRKANQLEKEEEVVSAVIIAENFNNAFDPITDKIAPSLLPIVNVPLLDYTLEALNQSGVETVFIFCSTYIDQVKQHIKLRTEKKCTWSIGMSVQIIASEGCRCLGDALRDIDAKGFIRGHFILLGGDTVFNTRLGPILEEHKRRAKFDKGTAMTVLYKPIAPGSRTGDEVVLAKAKKSNRLLFHQRLNPVQKEKSFQFPMEMFLLHSEVSIHHNYMDPQIAICSPTVLPLFSDNFDFETRDDFIRGLLINEEILGSTIYVEELQREQYAAKVSNWQMYKIVSNDIINRWTYPMVPDMGICCLFQNYIFQRRNIYRHRNTQVARGDILKENTVVNEMSVIGEQSTVRCSVIGKRCKIGQMCTIDNAYLMDDVIVGDNCVLNHCVIGRAARIGDGVKLMYGSVIGENVVLPANYNAARLALRSTELNDDNDDEGNRTHSRYERVGAQAFVIVEKSDGDGEEASDSDDEATDAKRTMGNASLKMYALQRNDEDSEYVSSSDDDDSRAATPFMDDANIFLNEVIDSLTRGYNDKSNPEFLILEINSSRYAYNMTLTEVNFYVVKAILSLPPLRVKGGNIVAAVNSILLHLGPVMKNYIRGDAAMADCLKAFEETCNVNEEFRPKVEQLFLYLYDKEIVSEEAILEWYDQIGPESHWMRLSLKKLIDWLLESSEEEDEDEDEEEEK